MSSLSKTLYIGMTNNLHRRVFEHKNKLIDGFSSKYSCTTLVYFEEYSQVQEAIEREKQLKKWNRSKKIYIITTKNPNWIDLSV